MLRFEDIHAADNSFVSFSRARSVNGFILFFAVRNNFYIYDDDAMFEPEQKNGFAHVQLIRMLLIVVVCLKIFIFICELSRAHGGSSSTRSPIVCVCAFD